jgi:hypothetical protein
MKKIIFFLLLLIYLMFSEFAQGTERSGPTGRSDAGRLQAAFPVQPLAARSE